MDDEEDDQDENDSAEADVHDYLRLEMGRGWSVTRLTLQPQLEPDD